MSKIYSDLDILNIIKIQSVIRKKYWYVNCSYLKNIQIKIRNIYNRKSKKYVHEPTMFGDNSKKNIKCLRTAFKATQKRMKEGELAQTVIGNWYGWEDFGQGHSSGLDCKKRDNSIIMEVKNRYNTTNSGSQKALLDKLSNYKKEYPSTRCIWGIVNPKSGCKKLCEKITYNGVEIEKIQGKELFKLVFSIGDIDYSQQIINIIKMYVNK